MAAKRILALLLALCLTVSIPVNALALEQAGDGTALSEDIAATEPDAEPAPAEDPSGTQEGETPDDPPDAPPEDPSGTQEGESPDDPPDAPPEDPSGTQDGETPDDPPDAPLEDPSGTQDGETPDDTTDAPPEDVLPEDGTLKPEEEELPVELFDTMEGDGTEENPYKITTEAHLIALALNQIENANISWYQLMNDIVLSSDTWTPIGRTDETAFNGVFDGNGHTISSSMQFQATPDTLSGIFGVNTGTIKNLTVNVTIVDTATDAGTLCARNYGKGTIENCFGYGSVASTATDKNIGGLVGYNTGRITGCGSGAEVNAPNSNGGGLVGWHRNGGVVEYCWAAGNVTANNAGGLIGYQLSDGAAVKTVCSYATNSQPDGGLIKGRNSAGGLIGCNRTHYWDYATSYVEYCYATGTIATGNSTGGLFGTCYTTSGGGARVYKYNYYNRSNTGNQYGFPVSTIEMQQQSTFYGWDFDHVWAIDSSINAGYPYISRRGSEIVSIQGTGTQTDPYQIENEEQLFAIGALKLENAMSAYYTLVNDIRLTANWWTPIGIWGDFTGVFDGNGHTISNLRFPRVDTYGEAGLFGYNGGTIKNLNVTDVRLLGRTYAGSVVAVNYRTVENCHVIAPDEDGDDWYLANVVACTDGNGRAGGLVGYSSGTIQLCGADCNVGGADQNVYPELADAVQGAAQVASGGLLGFNCGTGVVQYSWAAGYVTGKNAGGLIGEQYSDGNGSCVKTLNCYATGKVVGSSNSGGLIGADHSHYWDGATTSVEYCYASGRVEGNGSTGGLIGSLYSTSGGGYNHVRFSYYNQSNKGNKIGFNVSASDLKKADTFYGWDFDHIWQIDKSVNDGRASISLRGEPETIVLQGNGDEGNPYKIHNEQELWALVLDSGRYTLSTKYYYKLENDITVTAQHWTPIGGNGQNTFAGVFDGGGHTISGIKLSNNYYEYIGLFGNVNGTIRNLTVSAELEGVDWVGALTAGNSGTIENCHSSGKITNVKDGGRTGGLVGHNSGTITESSSTATVGGTKEIAGGLLGYNCGTGIVQHSWASGDVTGKNAGGLIGEQYSDGNGSCVKTLNCYATGKVVGSSNSGGLIGADHSHYWGGATTSVEYCYASGRVEGNGSTGGLIGSLYSTSGGGYNHVRYSYYNSQNTGNKIGFRIPLSEMTSRDSFYMWNFSNFWNISPDQNNGLPYIDMRGRVKPYTLDGEGDPDDPYLIESEEDLWVLVSGRVDLNANNYYELQNDIEVTANYWTPIGANGMPSFHGTFDGNGYTISGLRISDNFYESVGFIGANDGTIKNLTLSVSFDSAGTAGAFCADNNGTIENCASIGTVSCGSSETYSVGGLVGYNTGTIRESHSSVRVTAPQCRTGGLVGKSTHTGLIERCYAIGNVIGKYAGGLIGEQLSEANNCSVKTLNSYATGKVTGSSDSGGLIGVDRTHYWGGATAYVEYCYATGRVEGTGSTGGLIGRRYSTSGGGANVVTSSYYDSTLSEKEDIDKGTPLDSSQMKNQAQYVGWDFTNTWRIDPAKNSGYPYLAAVEPVTVMPVTGVRLDRTELALKVGSSSRLVATVEPSGAANKAVTWTSSDSTVATVAANGNVTALKAGTATITVTTDDGGYTAACTVTVTDTPPVVVAVTGVSLNKSSISIQIGGTETLTATVSPTNATNKSVTWATSNPSIATVSSSGVVTAVAAGTADIRVTTADGGKSATCKVTVPPAVTTVPVTGVTLNKTETTIEVGKTETLTATVEPANATNKSVTWSSSNTSVATVTGGVVTAVAAGTATITVTTADGSKTASCTVTVPAPAVSVTGVTLNKTNTTIEVGKTDTLIATVEPANATNKSVTWTSSDPSIATVSSGGVVTAVAEGTAIIAVTTTDGGKITFCTVNVLPQTIAVTGVTLNKTSTTIESGKTETLTATVEPGNATNKSVTWTSSNTSVATVSSSGVVTAVAAGEATITVTTADGSKTASCTVTVPAPAVPVTGVSLNKTSFSLTTGGGALLTATVIPANASNKNVSWSSSNTNVATVDSAGSIKAVGVGTTVITVTTEDGGKTAVCEVTVTAPPPTVIKVSGVTVSPTTLTLIEGATATLNATVSPGDAANRNVTWASSDSSVVTVSKGAVTAQKPGSATIKVITEDGGYTASVTVTVSPKPTELSSLELTGQVTTIQGMPLDLSGLTVTAVYSNGTRAVVTDYTVSGFNPEQVGSQTVTIGYGGKTASLTVTVVARQKSVTGIAIDTPPSKTSYTEGEALNTSGLRVKVSYNDGTDEKVTSGFSTSGYDPNTVGTQSVLVTYEGFTASFAVTVIGRSTGSSIAKPVIRIESVEGGKNVILSASEGSTIHYTTNGTTPNENSPTYNRAFIVTAASTVVKAIAVSDGNTSSVTTGTIKVSQAGGIDANPGGSTVQAGTIVTLRTATVGAEIYYTNDSNAAFSKETWTKYNGFIMIGETQTIRAIAVKDGYANSSITRLEYEVPEPPKDNVVISLGSVTVAAGDIASVPVYLFTDSDETPVKDFRISISFDEDSFENVVSITPAEGIDSTKLFTSSSGGVVNLLYQGDEIPGGGEICTLNFTTLASKPEGTKLDVEVNLGSSAVTTDAAGGSSLTSANAVITLTAARVNQATGTISYTNTQNGQVTNTIPDNASEIEANVTIDSDSVSTMRETTANVYLVVYDRDGRMASVDTWKVDLSDPAFMFIRTIKIPEGTNVGAIKIMVLSDQMVPIIAAGELAK